MWAELLPAGGRALRSLWPSALAGEEMGLSLEGHPAECRGKPLGGPGHPSHLVV